MGLINQNLQSTIIEISHLLKCDVVVLSSDYVVIAATKQMGIDIELIKSNKESWWIEQGRTYLKIEQLGRLGVVVIDRTDLSQLELELIGLKIKSDMINNQQGLFNKDIFFKELMNNQIAGQDLLEKSRQLKIKHDLERIVILLKCNDNDCEEIELLLKHLFFEIEEDYVLTMNRGQLLLIKSLKVSHQILKIDQIANMIKDMINTELMTTVYVSYGTPVESLKELSKSYQEALIAMKVGKIFLEEEQVFSYNHLGIGRLIYQMPLDLCETFMQEFVSPQCFDELNDEEWITIERFFENNLNISETARRLFIHRNTLIYRIEKINQLTGLDMRTFEGAITLKMLTMVHQYIKFIKGK